MPALPVVPNVVKWTMFYTLGADTKALSRMFIRYTGTPPNSAACIAIASALYTDFAAEFAGYMHNTCSIEASEITDLSNVSGGTGVHTAHTAGGLSGQALSAATAMLVTMGIARRYRGGKPRTYFPFGDGGSTQTVQTWTSSFVANIQTGLDTIVSDIAVTNSGGCNLAKLCNVSYYQGFTVVTNPVTGRARNVPKLRTTPVVDDALTWTAETTMASQRRRLLRQP